MRALGLGRDGRGRFAALVIGAAVASLVWLLAMMTSTTTPDQARDSRAAPDLPPASAKLQQTRLRQVTWARCHRGSRAVSVVAPSAPAGDRPLVTSVSAGGTTVATGTVLARVAGQPLIAVVTDAVLYRSLAAGDRGPDVRGFEDALAAAGLIDHADDVIDAETLAAWHRLDPTGSADRVSLDTVVAVPKGARIGDVAVSVGDEARKGSTLLEVQAAADVFECRVPDPPRGLTRADVRFKVGARAVQITSLKVRRRSERAPGHVRVGVPASVHGPGGRLGIVTADTGEPVLAAPLSAVKVAADGDASVVVVDGSSHRQVAVETGVSAQGLVQVTGEGLAAGTDVALFDPADAKAPDGGAGGSHTRSEGR